jgi:DUF1680 family protein
MKSAIVIGLMACAAQAYAGELTRRYELTLERILHGGPPRYTQDFLLADLIPNSGRRFHEFSGDLSGRYLGAVAMAGPDAAGLARELVPRIFSLQQADGGFGAPFSPSGATLTDMAKLWGHGRILVGLVEYYRATRDPRGLEAARRLGDFLVGHADRFNDPSIREALGANPRANGYICWTQNVEGLALLADAAEDERYRKAAAAIARTAEILPKQHTHGALSTLRGMLLLGEHDPSFIPEVEKGWESLEKTGNVGWNGGPPEYLDSWERDEGCASADWLRLNLALWRMTGRERYVETAEDALFNAFFGNQLPSGDFSHVTFSVDGFRAGAVEAWWCCTLHGLRAFPAVRDAAFRVSDGALYYDLPVDGRGVLGDLEVEADANLAREGRVTLHVLRAPASPVVLRIRKPARTVALRSPFGASSDPWLALDRIWKAGERIDVDYELETKVESYEGAKIVRRGPWTLGISEGGDMAYFNEGSRDFRVDWQSLAPGDRPSRVAAEFHSSLFGDQPAAVTFRPIDERWESAGHSLRWTTRFNAPQSQHSEPARLKVSRTLYENRIALASGLAAGALFSGIIALLWRRRARPR